MRGIMAASFMLAVRLYAQSSGLFSVQGEIQTERPQDMSQLTVEVLDQHHHQAVARAAVARDGTFDLRQIAHGDYEIRIADSFGNTLRSEYTSLSQNTPTLTLKLPSWGGPKPPSGNVSVAELKHHVDRKARHEFQLAQKAKARRDREGELEHLGNAIRMDPDFAEAYQQRGMNYLAAKEAGKAIGEFQQIARIHPGRPEVHSNLAIVLLQSGRVPEAEMEAKAALKLDPELQKAQYLLAVSLLKQRRMSLDDFKRTAVSKQWNLLR